MDNFIFVIPFNLPPPPDSSRKKGAIYEGNPCWMDKRLELFTTYTIPSLINQTDKEFYAILLCDPETPSKYKKIINQFLIDYPFIKVLWEGKIQWGSYQEKYYPQDKLLEYYKSFRKNNSNEIFAGRLDNDDSVFSGYVQTVKSVKQDCEIIAFSDGIFWDVSTNKFLKSYFPNGPFISTKSTLKNYLDPFRENHTTFTTTFPTATIKTDNPAWLQVCHGDNLWNELNRMPGEYVNVDIEELKNYFNIK